MLCLRELREAGPVAESERAEDLAGTPWRGAPSISFERAEGGWLGALATPGLLTAPVRVAGGSALSRGFPASSYFRRFDYSCPLRPPR